MEKEAKRIKKGEKFERFTVSFAIEYLCASMVGKYYEAFLFSSLQLKKIPLHALVHDFFEPEFKV